MQPPSDVPNMDDDASDVDSIKFRVDEIVEKTDQLEQRVTEVEEFYLSMSKKQPVASKGSSTLKERHVPSKMKQQQDALMREAAAAKRMKELIKHIGSILCQLSQHKWAFPFNQPVDVAGLGLDDYYQVIDKPMDFSTIKNQMEATDGTGYKNVREICADIRLVFKNAMKYNEAKSDVHVMAKTLLGKFEEKWLQLLPKVTEEEKRREEEEAEAQFDMQLSQEAAHAKLARDLSNEVYELDMHLEEIRDMVVLKCRKMSTEEKRKLGAALSKLPADDVSKALEIVAQSNPAFQSTAEEVDLDIDAQSELTLWRLKFFVKDALEAQAKNAASIGGGTTTMAGNNKVNNTVPPANNVVTNNNHNNNKRKREICDAIAKTAKKKSRKPSLDSGDAVVDNTSS